MKDPWYYCNRGKCGEKADIETWQYVILKFDGEIQQSRFNPDSEHIWLCRDCYELVKGRYNKKYQKDKGNGSNTIIFGREPTLEHVITYDHAIWFNNTLFSEPKTKSLDFSSLD